MKAIRVGETPEFALEWADVPTLSDAAGVVRIRVHASEVIRADLLQRQGHYPPPAGASSILGLECAGVIDAVGEGVPTLRIGERVCALLAGGGYAQFATCLSSHAIPIPEGISFEQAASIPEVWATVWLKLIHEGGLKAGETVLVHAGASGVGSAAVQLCRQMRSPCFVTVGTAAKLSTCKQLGAEQGAIRTQGPWLDALKQWRKSGVDVILDPVGAPYLDANLRSLATNGRLIVLGHGRAQGRS